MKSASRTMPNKDHIMLFVVEEVIDSAIFGKDL
jgi:hypothetical protein